MTLSREVKKKLKLKNKKRTCSETFSDFQNSLRKLKNNLKMTSPNGKIGKKINLNNNKNLEYFKETKTLKLKSLKSNSKSWKIETKIITNKIIQNANKNSN